MQKVTFSITFLACGMATGSKTRIFAPMSCRTVIRGIDAASRMSSVFGLNARRSFPRKLLLPPQALGTLLAIARLRCSFTATTDSTIRSGVVLCGLDQRPGVLGKVADPVIQSDPARNFLDIGADLLGDNFINEGDLRRQEGISRVFRQLGCPTISVEERRSIEIKRPIDLPITLRARSSFVADHDTVGMLEVPYQAAHPQKFRIRHNSEVSARALFADDPLVASSDGHGRLCH